MSASIAHRSARVNADALIDALSDDGDLERAPWSASDYEAYLNWLADSDDPGHDIHGDCPYTSYECPDDSAGDAMDDDGPAEVPTGDPWYPWLRRVDRVHLGVSGLDDSDADHYRAYLDRPKCIVKQGGADYFQVLWGGRLVGLVEFDEDDEADAERAEAEAEDLAWRIDHPGR